MTVLQPPGYKLVTTVFRWHRPLGAGSVHHAGSLPTADLSHAAGGGEYRKVTKYILKSRLFNQVSAILTQHLQQSQVRGINRYPEITGVAFAGAYTP